MSQTPRVALVWAALSVACVILLGVTANSQSPSYLYTFDGSPPGPQPFRPPDWEVVANVENSYQKASGNEFDSMHADHGSACGAPPETHNISSLDDAVFLCRDHVMTAINGDTAYAAVYLTPNQMVDFSSTEGVVKFDVSTLRRSDRDWIDVWITPYEDSLMLPLEDSLPPYAGEPRRAIHLRMDNGGGGSIYRIYDIRNFSAIERTTGSGSIESRTTPSATVRTPFELRITRTHLKFGAPTLNLWWIDANIPDLGWTQGVVQFGQHSYDPYKGLCLQGGCGPGSWHWDNVSIAPALPFTILRGSPKILRPDRATRIDLPGPAPQNAHLRFIGVANSLDVSYNGGSTWQAAQLQAQERVMGEHYRTFWTPIPAGTTAVQVRGTGYAGYPWEIRDASVWSKQTTASPAPAAPSNLRISSGS
jgi:hypothetical protein